MENKMVVISVKFSIEILQDIWVVSFYIDPPGHENNTFWWINKYSASTHVLADGQTLEGNVSVEGAKKILRKYLKTVK